MRHFETGATRDSTEGKPDYRRLLSPQVLRRFGQYMLEHRVQADGQTRALDNWKKGIPQQEYLSSLLRHVVDYWATTEHNRLGPKEVEDLLCAILFNVQGLLHERLEGGVPAAAKAPTTWDQYLDGSPHSTYLSCREKPLSCTFYPFYLAASSRADGAQ